MCLPRIALVPEHYRSNTSTLACGGVGHLNALDRSDSRLHEILENDINRMTKTKNPGTYSNSGVCHIAGQIANDNFEHFGTKWLRSGDSLGNCRSVSRSSTSGASGARRSPSAPGTCTSAPGTCTSLPGATWLRLGSDNLLKSMNGMRACRDQQAAGARGKRTSLRGRSMSILEVIMLVSRCRKGN